MSKNRYKDGKSKREPGRFLALPAAVTNSPAFVRLSPYAVKLLIDIGSQYKGHNNGDLCAAWKIMKPRGWRSEATLHKAKQELLNANFITEMRKGRRPNVCALYALTWLDLDPSDKHDFGKGGFQRGAWKTPEPLVKPAPKARGKIATLTTPPMILKAA